MRKKGSRRAASSQVATLTDAFTEQPMREEEVLLCEGAVPAFFLLAAGEVGLASGYGPRATLSVPGQFFGELDPGSKAGTATTAEPTPATHRIRVQNSIESGRRMCTAPFGSKTGHSVEDTVAFFFGSRIDNGPQKEHVRLRLN